MTLELHNTLAGMKQPFVPADPTRVAFYTCGPTVYDSAHIGNFRAFLFSDLLRRWIESPLCELRTESGDVHTGPRNVHHVMNLTDVGHMTDDQALDGGGEDKMEAARKRLLEAKKAGNLPTDVDIDPRNPSAVAEFYIGAFLTDARALGLKVAEEYAGANTDDAREHFMPRATREIRAMLEMVEKLIERGHAYIASDSVCYFDTQSFPDYGLLSGNTLEKIRSGAGGRVSQTAQAVKKHPADFMLWKPDPTHLMRWDPSKVLGRASKLKEGYPGWHIECSAMALRVFARQGEQWAPEIDLHSGGEDNIFPHHECEIAQSRGLRDADHFARCWVHVRHLFVEGEKMSKSKGNFFTVRQLLEKGFDPAAIRLELLKTHYRSNANFTEQGLKDSARRVKRWRRLAQELTLLADLNEPNLPEFYHFDSAIEQFKHALNDDLNVSAAIASVDSELADSRLPMPAEVLDTFVQLTGHASMEDALESEDIDLPHKPMSIGDAQALLAEVSDGSAPRRALGALHLIDSVLGVIFRPPTQLDSKNDPDAAKIEDLIEARRAARANKDFAEADRIRDEIDAMGVEITDTPQGTTWKRKASL